MASVKKKQRKNGSFFYEISVSRGYSKSPYTMRWDIPEGLATKTVKARLRDVAAKFEQDCKNGKVKTRKERNQGQSQTLGSFHSWFCLGTRLYRVNKLTYHLR